MRPVKKPPCIPKPTTNDTNFDKENPERAKAKVCPKIEETKSQDEGSVNVLFLPFSDEILKLTG